MKFFLSSGGKGPNGKEWWDVCLSFLNELLEKKRNIETFSSWKEKRHCGLLLLSFNKPVVWKQKGIFTIHPDNVCVAGEGNGSPACNLKMEESWWVFQGSKLKSHLFKLQIHLFKLQLCTSSLKCNRHHKLHTLNSGKETTHGFNLLFQGINWGRLWTYVCPTLTVGISTDAFSLPNAK